MGKVMVIDVAKCNGCYNCQIACKDEHVDNDWSPIAKPQPETGQFWMKLVENIRGQVPKVKIAYTHNICQHCDNAPCIAACTSEAISKRADGLVIINPEKCSGGRNCVSACPYGVIYFNDDLQIAQKCTWCAHLLDKGWKEPRCVDACPTGALSFGEEKVLAAKIAESEILQPEQNTKPRTYFMGLPKRFIAGAVYDPQADECLANCAVTLTGANGLKLSSRTDIFGDFWFEQIEPGIYNLKMEKEGYQTAAIENINASQDINVGDIELCKLS